MGLTIAEGVLPLFLSYDQTLGMPLEHLWFSNNKQTVGNGEVNWWHKKGLYFQIVRSGVKTTIIPEKGLIWLDLALEGLGR